MPLHSRGHAVAQHQGAFYFLGGMNAEDAPSFDTDDPNPPPRYSVVYRYDPASGKWTERSHMLAGMYSLTARVLGDKIYAFGGYGEGGFDSTLQIYDPTTDMWTEGPPMPSTRYTFSSQLVDGKVYVMGGQGPIDNPDAWEPRTLVEVFDPASGWSIGNPLPYLASDFASCSSNGRIFAFGGDYGNRTQIYDVAGDTWSQGTPSPVARGGHTCVSVGEQLILLGGRDGVGALDLVERYNPVADSWETLDPMPTARYWFAAAALESKVYVFGGEAIGANTEYYGLLNQIDVLDLAATP